MRKKSLLVVALMSAALAALVLPAVTLAGTGGAAFDPIWQWLAENIQGTLGRIIAAAMIVVGLVGGIARQSIIAFAVGIGGGIGLYNSPPVLESMISATLPVLADAATVSIIASSLATVGMR